MNLKEGQVFKGNINDVMLEVVDTRKDNNIEYVYFKDMKTKKIYHTTYSNAKRLLLTEVKEE